MMNFNNPWVCGYKFKMIQTIFFLGDYTIPVSTINIITKGKIDVEILNCWFNVKKPDNDKEFIVGKF